MNRNQSVKVFAASVIAVFALFGIFGLFGVMVITRSTQQTVVAPVPGGMAPGGGYGMGMYGAGMAGRYGMVSGPIVAGATVVGPTNAAIMPPMGGYAIMGMGIGMGMYGAMGGYGMGMYGMGMYGMGRGMLPVGPNYPHHIMLGLKSEREQLQPLIDRFQKINLALIRYRLDHEGELPMWLSDLHPHYIEDRSTFRTPSGMPQGGIFAGVYDPKMTVEFMFEFAPPAVSRGFFGLNSPSQDYRTWKTGQLEVHGDRVPVVRYLPSGVGRTLNISYGGEIYFSDLFWEGEVASGKTLDDHDAQVRWRLQRIAVALDDFLQTHGELPPTLEALVPDYLEDGALLNDPVTGDPFAYEYPAEENLHAEWKKLLDEYGGYVPVVRVPYVSPVTVINLAYGGNIWEGSTNWRHDLDREFLPQPQRQTSRDRSRPVPSWDAMDVILPGENNLEDATLQDFAVWASLVTSMRIDVENGGDAPLSGVYAGLSLRTMLETLLPPLGLDYYRKDADTVVIANAEAVELIKTPPPEGVRKTEADMQALSIALNSFYLDYGQYPLPGASGTLEDASLTLENGRTVTILHPVMYINIVPRDPFSPEGGGYRYHSNGRWYILASNGPNQIPDMDVTRFNPEEGVGSEHLIELRYDPMKGRERSGDIFVFSSEN